MPRKIRPFLVALLSLMALWLKIAEAATLTVPDPYPTIASALSAAANNIDPNDTIVLSQGTYNEHVTLIPNVILKADDTAQTALTIIDGNGAGTVITASGGDTIQRLTITNGDFGIAVPASVGLVTVNNSIITHHNTSGIQCTGTNSFTISYTTLDSNGTAVTCSNSSVTIIDNIISNNTVNDISLIQSTAKVEYNLFSNNGREDYVNNVIRTNPTTNITEANAPNNKPDPRFVNPNNNDFHLQAGSPAITADNNGNEIGVYGGGNNDPPFPVSNLRVTTTTDSGIDVSWDPNLAYNVQGYKVYYNPDQPGTPANPSSLVNATTYTITIPPELITTPQPPDSPSNLSAGIGDSELFLGWSPVDEFTVSEYKINYGTVSGVYDVTIVVANSSSSSYSLTDLVNGTTYYIAIEAVATPVYFVTVTALDNTSASNYATPVEAHLTSPEAPSDLSPEISATPEPPERFPNLSNEGGCFIATAAYGSPLEPHVRTLRAFRDRYLLTHTLGRGFVAVYYLVSPPLARWLEAHTSFKPVVRASLSPIVFVTKIWMSVTSFVQMLIITLVLSLVGFSISRWRISRWGGHY